MRHGESGTQQGDVLWLQQGFNQVRSLVPSSLLGYSIDIFQLTTQMTINFVAFGENRRFISSEFQENFLKMAEIYQKPCETPRSGPF